MSTVYREPLRPGASRPSRARGFSILELLVVVAVLAILAAISILSVLDAMKRARFLAAIESVREIQGAFERYYLDNDRYPYTSEFDTKTLAPLAPIYIQNPRALLKPFDLEEIHKYNGPSPSDPDVFTWHVHPNGKRRNRGEDRLKIEVDQGEIRVQNLGDVYTPEEAIRRAGELL